jgi:hypothetical protein
MKEIIPAVKKDVLVSELTHDKFVRKTNNGNNIIYCITHLDSPNVLREIGRLRELTFRAAGGGTGKELDIDEFDISATPYKQLIVWNPSEQEIVGGYRYICCKDAVNADGEISLATTELLEFSERFKKEFLPFTIELGRSFIQPKYQPGSTNRKGLFSLDNLWDGLGAITVDNPAIRYLYGKVTMYTHYNVLARDMILTFMSYYFPDKDKLVWPYHPIFVKNDMTAFVKSLAGLNYKDGHHLLNSQVRALDENIPPLINSYMNLSATMRTFGTSINTHFGNVEETGILVTIADIYPSKKERHISSYMNA